MRLRSRFRVPTLRLFAVTLLLVLSSSCSTTSHRRAMRVSVAAELVYGERLRVDGSGATTRSEERRQLGGFVEAVYQSTIGLRLGAALGSVYSKLLSASSDEDVSPVSGYGLLAGSIFGGYDFKYVGFALGGVMVSDVGGVALLPSTTIRLGRLPLAYAEFSFGSGSPTSPRFASIGLALELDPVEAHVGWGAAMRWIAGGDYGLSDGSNGVGYVDVYVAILGEWGLVLSGEYSMTQPAARLGVLWRPSWADESEANEPARDPEPCRDASPSETREPSL